MRLPHRLDLVGEESICHLHSIDTLCGHFTEAHSTFPVSVVFIVDEKQVDRYSEFLDLYPVFYSGFSQISHRDDGIGRAQRIFQAYAHLHSYARYMSEPSSGMEFGTGRFSAIKIEKSLQSENRMVLSIAYMKRR